MSQPPENQQQYGSVLTILGENAEQNGKLKNKQIQFTHMAIGDANDTYVQPDRKQTVLVNELARIPVNSVDVSQPTPDSVPMLKVEAILPDDVNDLVIREFAAVATFDGNSYFHAVGTCARIYVPPPVNNGNVSVPVSLEMTFIITSVEPIVVIDPNVVTASREWVHGEIKKSSESDSGGVQLVRTQDDLNGSIIDNESILYLTDINVKYRMSPPPPKNAVVKSFDLDSGKLSYLGDIVDSHLYPLNQCPSYKNIYVDIFPYLGNLSLALDHVEEGDVLLLGSKTYNIVGKHHFDTASPSDGGNWTGNKVKNVKILGSRMPKLSSDGSRFIEGTGTIVQGSLINYADGFECYNVGIDVGDYVVDTLSNGTHLEGFVAGTHKWDSSWDDHIRGGYIKDVHFGNIKILMKKPVSGDFSTYKHNCLVEYIDGGSHGYVEVIGGFHGFVMKSRNITANGVVKISKCSSNSFYFKSDRYTQCFGYKNGVIVIGDPNNVDDISPPLLFTTANGVEIRNLDFEVQAYNVSAIISEATCSAQIKNVVIKSLIVDRTLEDAVVVPFYAEDWVIGTHLISKPGKSGIKVVNGSINCHIGDGHVVDAHDHGYELTGIASHGDLRASNCGGYGVFNKDGSARVNPAKVTAVNCTLGAISSLYKVPNVTFLNDWSDKKEAGEDFALRILGSSISVVGRLGGNADGKPNAGEILTVPTGYRPKGNRRWVCAGWGADGFFPALVEYHEGSGVLYCKDFNLVQGDSAATGIDLTGVDWIIDN